MGVYRSRELVNMKLMGHGAINIHIGLIGIIIDVKRFIGARVRNSLNA